MKYAVIRSGGKQYKVTEGDIVDLERLPVQGGKVSFDDVLLYTDGTDVQVGRPIVDGVTVTGVVLEQVRGEKIRVAKYKAKVRYRRVTGHRQALSRVKIEAIGTSVAKPKGEKADAPKRKPRAKKEA